MKTYQSIVAAATLALVPCVAGAQATVSERSISMNAALELAQTALQACRAAGYKVTITVLNRHTRPIVVLSDDGVNPHTIENSLRKAYTAFTTRSPSGEMAKRPPVALQSFMQLANITALEGALPIFAGKELIGSVGISGAPGGEKDAACAQAGIDKISAGLN